MASLAVGCGDDPEYPRPPPSDGGGLPNPEPLRTLELVDTAPSFALGLLEPADFEVQYREADGTPISDQTVTFALEGNAHDASLSAFEATTRSDGRASGTLTAGSTAAAFRIRISAAHAASIHIDVSVSDVGFGDIAVTVVDGVEGRDVDRFVVRLYAEAFCDDVDLEDTPPAREVVASEDMTALLSSLPADLTYAVVARAEGAAGGALGWGCADTEVEADGQVDVEITVVNVPLKVEGTYEGRLQVEAEVTSAMAADVVETAGDALLSTSGGDADLLLDAIQAYLHAEDPDLALIFAEQRELMEPDLADALDADGVGGHLAVEEVADALWAALGSFHVLGPLQLDASNEDEPASWHIDQLEVAHADTAQLLPLPEMEAQMDVVLHLDRDEVDLLSLQVPLPLGNLAIAVLRSLTRDGEALAEAFWTRVGCDTLIRWVQEGPVAIGMCDAECAEVACPTAGAWLVAAMEDAAAGLTASHGQLGFDAPVTDGTLTDTDGDGTADQVAFPPLSGLWTAAGNGAGDTVSGVLDATRTGDLP
jgi:hypothetical protein